MVCKLSIVIPGSDHPGAILNTSAIPQIGDRLRLAAVTVEVLEVVELLPPRGDYHFVHATCKIVAAADGQPAGPGAGA